MTSTVVIVHGWGGDSEGGWEPWLADELKKRGVTVIAPDMPNTKNPTIQEWVSSLGGLVGEVSDSVYFVGHSMGCQAIIRYLETLSAGKSVGGAVFVAPWTTLTDYTYDEEYTRDIAKPWIETPIDWAGVASHSKMFVCIYSDNDPYVPVENAQLFKEKLNAKLVLDSGRGHFTEEEDITQLPSVLDELLVVMGLPVETTLI